MARKRRQVSTPSDYGIDPSRSGGTWSQPVRVTRGGSKPQNTASGGSVPKLVGTSLVGPNTSTILGPDGKPVTPVGAMTKDPLKPLAASNYLTNAEQAQVAAAPSRAQKEQAAKEDQPWWSRIFDTSDTWVENEDGSTSLNTGDLGFMGLEGLTDSLLRGLEWGTDRINQGTVAALSAAPGGTRTLSWDEAGQVSFGQQIVANAGVTQGRISRGEATFGDQISLLLGGPASIGAYVASVVDPDTPVQQRGFDITSEQDRSAFDQGWEKFFAGGADFGFVFADPTLVAGWAMKAGRVRYIDRLIDSPERMTEAIDGVVEGGRVLANQLDNVHGTQAVIDGTVSVAKNLGDAGGLNISPTAAFLHNATRVDEAGRKAMSYQAIYNHKVIKYAGNRDALALALHNADDYDTASLIYRYAIGDSTAAEEMLAKRPDLLTEIIDGERQVLNAALRANPAKQAEVIGGFETKMTKYDDELQWLKDNGGTAEQLEFVRTKKNKVARDWLEANNGDISEPINDATAALAKARVDRLIARDELLRRTLDEAGLPNPSGVRGSLQGSTKAFSKDNALGRAVERSRQKRAQAQYETEATRGVRLWGSTDFAHLNTAGGRATRALRVWRYLGAEAPAGIVHMAGIGAQESVREVRAMLNSVRLYGGGQTLRRTAADGSVIEMTGVVAKDDMLTRYANAIAKGGVEGQDEAQKALRLIEEQIKTDLADTLGYDIEHINTIFNEINRNREALKKQILERGFWMEGKVEHKSPYLESHLQGAEIMPNYRAVEARLADIAKESNHAYRKGVDVAKAWTADSYALFQDLWRPATLLRLGYTQRNVAEGLFRASAQQFSLMPVVDAVRQGGLSVGNVSRRVKYGKSGARGTVEKATVAAREGTQMPKKYVKWHEAQTAAIESEIARNNKVMDFAYEQLATESKAWRDGEIARLNARTRQLLDEKNRMNDFIADPEGAAIPGMTVDQAESIVTRNTVLVDESYERLRKIVKITGGEEGPLSPHLVQVADDIEYLSDAIHPMLTAQAEMLHNPKSAVTMYRQQTLAKRRLWQGQGEAVDAATIKGVTQSYRNGQAFDVYDSYSNIALMNLSSDHTTRQAMNLQMQTVERLLTKERVKSYVAVNPGQEGYWEGMATVLSQWKSSDVGQIIIKEIADGNLTDEQIAFRVASFLRDNPRGREVAEAITDMSKATVTKGNRSRFADYADRSDKARKAADKATEAEIRAMNEARAAIQTASDEVAEARRVQRAEQAASPRYSRLELADGTRIDEVRHVEKATAARDKAVVAHKAVASKTAENDAAKAISVANEAAKDARAQYRRTGKIVNENGNTVKDPEKYIARREEALAKARQAEKDRRAAVKVQAKALEDAKSAVVKARADVIEAKRLLKERNAANPRTVPLKVNGKTIDPDRHVAKAQTAYERAAAAYETKHAKLNVVPALPDSTFGPVMSVEDATDYGVEMVRRYRDLTAHSEDLQKTMLGTQVLSQTGQQPLAEFARSLENMLGKGAKRADGSDIPLIPVVGNAAEELGSPKFLDTMRGAFNLGFRALGTIPEDTFVRAPYYGRRWQTTFDEAFNDLLTQRGDAGVSMKEINVLRDQAHRRALKDTKDWLYTIDRRTLLGSYGEYVFPFISASQNSVTTVGRMIWNDPRILAVMNMIWQAPDKAGIADENGDMHFTLPLEWLPEPIRNATGLSAMMEITYNKSQFDLISPNPGSALPIPQPGPVAVVPFSEMMKHEFIFSPTPPTILTGILGEETGTNVWEATKAWMYGTDPSKDYTGMSKEFLSWDKLAPAWAQKAIQMWQGEGSSSAYTSWYNRIYQSEYMKWAAGERDAPPTPEEVSAQTSGFYWLRMAMNLTQFTPPGFTSQFTPIMESVQHIYDTEPDYDKARQKIYNLYGPTITELLKVTTTSSVAGLDASAESLNISREHGDMIGAIAPSLEANDSLNTLGILANERGEYDPSFSAAQQITDIPNTNRQYREVRSPAEAAVEAQKSAGWSVYLKNMDVLNSVLAQRGLKSLSAKGAEDLRATKDQMVETLRNDPRYLAWYSDYQNFSSSRTLDSVMVIQTALNDQKWRDNHKEDPVWGQGGAADQYMYARQQTVEALNSTTDTDMRRELKSNWQEFRFELGLRYPGWGTKAEKYLSGDDNPENPQVVLQSASEQYTPETDVPVNDQMPQPQQYGSQNAY